MKILLVGLGGFGRNHLRAWLEMGLGADLHVAELNEALHAECRKFNFPSDRVLKDYKGLLREADIVDIVTPTQSHAALCREALLAGKDVFVEKPMTLTVQEAEGIAALAAERGRILQVGYYYRFHPISAYLKKQIDSGEMGSLRYLSGRFMGFKRARTDVGVTHTDAIHFLDLFNWLVGTAPEECYAVTRDHFGRGMEDFSVVLLKYPGGTVAQVESGYIQPGKWRDKVVPGAYTTKEISVVGSLASADADFETENLRIDRVRHEFRDGTWWPSHQGSSHPQTGTATPVEMIKLELGSFLARVQDRAPAMPGARESGVVLARLMESIYRSAEENRPIALDWGIRTPTAVAV